MSKLDIWMPFYIADYLADTMHLTTVQHGAYFLLLMHHWKNGSLPDDDAQLASIARCDARLWRASIAPILRPFFDAEAGCLTQKRLLAERDRTAAITGKRAKAGREGAERRWGKDEKPVANAKQTDGKAMANAMAKSSQTDGISQSQSQKEEKPPSLRSVPPAADPSRGSRLAPDWQPDAQCVALAEDLRLDAAAVAATFRDYWHGRAGKDGRKADWAATWRNWCRREAERRRGTPGGGAGVPTRAQQQNARMQALRGDGDAAAPFDPGLPLLQGRRS
jgi:uncharacterized protein YdaU (DUF1376 family)